MPAGVQQMIRARARADTGAKTLASTPL